jgi:hypothetical protein
MIERATSVPYVARVLTSAPGVWRLRTADSSASSGRFRRGPAAPAHESIAFVVRALV